MNKQDYSVGSYDPSMVDNLSKGIIDRIEAVTRQLSSSLAISGVPGDFDIRKMLTDTLKNFRPVIIGNTSRAMGTLAYHNDEVTELIDATPFGGVNAPAGKYDYPNEPTDFSGADVYLSGGDMWIQRGEAITAILQEPGSRIDVVINAIMGSLTQRSIVGKK